MIVYPTAAERARRPEVASESAFAQLRRSARQATRMLKAMANEHRLLILCQTLGRERSVSELVRVVGLSQSALSQHLAKLRRYGLVRTRRQAQTVYYSLASREIEAIIGTLYELYCSAGDKAEEGTIPTTEPASQV